MGKRKAFTIDLVGDDTNDIIKVADDGQDGITIDVNDGGEWSLDMGATKALHEALGEIIVDIEARKMMSSTKSTPIAAPATKKKPRADGPSRAC